MWTPADKDALPTSTDLGNAREAIYALEKELVEVQLRVRQLREELEERRAWIAPIRKLSYDTLSLVFIECANQDWKAPVVVSTVCRLWRDVVLGTPQAWSYVHIGGDMSSDCLGMFSQRSGCSMLRVELTSKNDFYMLTDYVERIQRIVAPNLPSVVNLPSFPNTKSLRVKHIGIEVESLSNILYRRFPALTRLEVIGMFIRPNITASLRQRPVYPPLQVLRLSAQIASGRAEWHDLLWGCQATLVSLEIDIKGSRRPLAIPTIDLPRLQYLGINLTESGIDTLYANLTTPALATYMQGVGGYKARRYLVHSNLDTITHLRVDFVPPLETLPQLCVLQLMVPRADHRRFFERLDLEGVCPKLYHLEFRLHKGDSRPEMENSESLAARNRPLLKVLFSSDRWTLDPPGIIDHW